MKEVKIIIIGNDWLVGVCQSLLLALFKNTVVKVGMIIGAT